MTEPQPPKATGPVFGTPGATGGRGGPAAGRPEPSTLPTADGVAPVTPVTPVTAADPSTALAGSVGAPGSPPADGRTEPGSAVRFLARTAPVWLVVAFVVWLAETQAPTSLGADRAWITVGCNFLALAVAAIAVNLLTGFTGRVSLAHPGFVVLGAFVAAAALPGAGLWTLPAAAVLGAGVGAGVGAVVARTNGLVLTAATAAFAVAVNQLGSAFPGAFGDQPVRSGLRWEDLPYARANPFLGELYTYALLCGAALVVAWLVRRGRSGRALLALQHTDAAAQKVGVHPRLATISVFAGTAAMVAVLGAVRGLGAPLTGTSVVSTDLATLSDGLMFVAAAALGGLGTLSGPVVGAAALALLSGLPALAPSTFGQAWVEPWLSAPRLPALAIVLVALLRPEGVVGWIRRRLADAAWLQALYRTTEIAPTETAAPQRPRQLPSITAPALEVHDVTVRFGGVTAVEGVSLVVERGSVHAIVGPNGSGRSTLIDVVSGVRVPDSGRVVHNGVDVTARPALERTWGGLARTTTHLEQWPDLTVLENVMLGAHTRSGWRESRRVAKRAQEMLDFCKLNHRRDEPTTKLNLLEVRTMEIARALASDPWMLLLDEPAAGMQPQEVRALARLLRAIRAEKVAILVVEQRLDLVRLVADHVTALDCGVVAAGGPTAEVLAERHVEEPLRAAAAGG